MRMFHPHDFGGVLDDPVINREGIAGAVHPEKPPFVSQVIGNHFFLRLVIFSGLAG
jgi:hypothetical protein